MKARASRFRTFVTALTVAALTVGAAPRAQGDLLVSNVGNAGPPFGGPTVKRYDETTGAFIGNVFPPLTGGNPPTGLVFGPDGNLYVCDGTAHSVKRFNGSTGALMGDFVPPGSGGLSSPQGLVFGPDGNLYVCSPISHNVLRYNGTTGAFIDVFVAGSLSGAGGTLHSPFDLVFGPDGDLYVSNIASHNVLRYEGVTGAPLPVPGQPGAIFASGGGLIGPRGLAFGPDGNLYVSDNDIHRVKRYHGPAGAVPGAYINDFVPFASGGLNAPRGLRFGPDGNLYVCSFGTDQVKRYQGPTGAMPGAFIDNFASGSGLDAPIFLIFRATPSSLTAEALSDTRVFLQWQDNSGYETGYRIARKPGGPTAPGSYTEIRVVGTNATRFVDIGLTSGNTYTYKVRAQNAVGFSDYSNEATVTTLVPPAAPSNLTAAAAPFSRVVLNWTDNSTDERAFRIARKAGTGSYVEIRTVPANVTRFYDAGLAPGTTYMYQVRAASLGGFSPYSNEAAAAVPALPGVPGNVTATATGADRIRLTWTDTSDNEQGFRIARRKGAEGYREIRVMPPGSTAFVDVGLTAGTPYTYRIRTYNVAGFSAYSDEAPATTLRQPAAPSSLIATRVSATQVRISWRDSSTDETSFRIERSSDGVTFGEIAAVGAGVTTYTHAGAAAGAHHYYRVRALGPGGYSPYSNVAHILP